MARSRRRNYKSKRSTVALVKRVLGSKAETKKGLIAVADTATETLPYAAYPLHIQSGAQQAQRIGMKISLRGFYAQFFVVNSSSADVAVRVLLGSYKKGGSASTVDPVSTIYELPDPNIWTMYYDKLIFLPCSITNSTDQDNTGAPSVKRVTIRKRWHNTRKGILGKRIQYDGTSADDIVNEDLVVFVMPSTHATVKIDGNLQTFWKDF